MYSAMYTSSSSLEFYIDMGPWVLESSTLKTASKMALNGIFLHLQHGWIIHLLLGNSPTQNRRTAVAGLEGCLKIYGSYMGGGEVAGCPPRP